jgi:hypothetical protein
MGEGLSASAATREGKCEWSRSVPREMTIVRVAVAMFALVDCLAKKKARTGKDNVKATFGKMKRMLRRKHRYCRQYHSIE